MSLTVYVEPRTEKPKSTIINVFFSETVHYDFEPYRPSAFKTHAITKINSKIEL